MAFKIFSELKQFDQPKKIVKSLANLDFEIQQNVARFKTELNLKCFNNSKYNCTAENL